MLSHVLAAGYTSTVIVMAAAITASNNKPWHSHENEWNTKNTELSCQRLLGFSVKLA